MIDSVVMANEVVEKIIKRKKSCVIVKVDFEKSYDFVRWEFYNIWWLEYVLRVSGLGGWSSAYNHLKCQSWLIGVQR